MRYAYLHWLITNTVQARNESREKVVYGDLLCLYCMIMKRPANVAYILLTRLARQRKEGAHLCDEPFITTLARSLHVLDTMMPLDLGLGPETEPFPIYDMHQIPLITPHGVTL